MLEAMSMGLPIIQRDDPINKGQVVEGVNGFIFKDKESFINKLNYIYNLSEKDRIELSKNVRNSVIRSNTKGNMAKKVLEVYQKAIKIYG